jgi:hypothetical protein
MKRAAWLTALPALLALLSCGSEGGPTPAATSTGSAPPNASAAPSTSSAAQGPKAALTRAEFNRFAVYLDLPLFWIDDTNNNGMPDADEIAAPWGVASPAPVWAQGGKLTPAFQTAYDQILAYKTNGPKEDGLSPEEKARRAAVRAELDQGRPAAVRSDFRSASSEEKAIVLHVMEAAKIIERIYARQQGVLDLAKGLSKDDPASMFLFYRNQGPFCRQPKTESDPNCSALPNKPKRISGLYPASIQSDPKFCETLEKDKDAKSLLFQFAAVTEEGGKLKAVPYNVAFKDDMTAVSDELKKAAAAITSAEENPLKEYLAAASAAFLDNDWPKADEAWAKMNVNNSKFYLRIGPDEVYGEPCSHKAGFHVSFARINQDSLKWQKKLEPVKKDMEEALAKMAGPPYKARDVKFHLPDFIDIILNAGDSRDAIGATIGQSLPNWGPVAEKGGRTVAMTNLYTDKDSLDALRTQISSVFCKSAVSEMSMDADLLTMSTVLHEAAHNLGPAHEYKVGGKADVAVFGGPLASTLEELKAQTSALFFADWLAEKGIIDPKQATQSHYRDIAWGFGHISNGMYDANNKPKPYSQLAAIQVGWLLKAGSVVWKADEPAANATDKGCFAVDMSKFKPAIAELEKTVLEIKSKGDKEGAEKLRTEFVDADGEWKKLRETLRDRWLRVPKTSFVYAIDL